MGDALTGLPLAELRARRDDVRAAEQRLSYLRRLLHAQLDIVDAATELPTSDELPGLLAAALADGPAGSGRAPRAVDLDVDPAAELPPLPDLRALSVDDRAALADRLRDRERELSADRTRLLEELDQLQAALVERYRTEGIDVDELLRGEA